jgi:hypothetical protein
MPDFDDLDGPVTSPRLVDLYEATAPAVRALGDSIAPLAAKRPTEPVSAATLDVARTLFKSVRRIVSRQPGARALLELAPPLDWAGLATKLALAQAALRRFENTYRDFDMLTKSGYWRTPAAVEMFSAFNGLDEKS